MEKLDGGNMSDVIKKGNLLYRSQGTWSPSVHRLLLHLEKQGFDDCPRFLGISADGREKLSYVPGQCREFYPGNLSETEHMQGIVSLAGLMNRFHQASSSFIQKDTDIWMLAYTGNLEKEVICHNDIAPYNVTFQNNLPYKLIDFDTCCPGPRIWDIVYALYRFVPVTDESASAAYIQKCITVFFDHYGMQMPTEFFQILVNRLQALIDTIHTMAENGNEAFLKMIEDGHADFYRKEIACVQKRFLV